MATFIVDETSGQLTIEGLDAAQLDAVASDLLSDAHDVNCARPLVSVELPTRMFPAPMPLRVARIYHGAVSEGPGRRSVVQLQGCPIRCPGCYVPQTHDFNAGVELDVADVVGLLLDEHEPRDGVTILGGEPFAQAHYLASLVRALKRLGEHVTVYSGYTLEQLLERGDDDVDEVLALVDLLIDGPFMREHAQSPGEWRGSANQAIWPGELIRLVQSEA